MPLSEEKLPLLDEMAALIATDWLSPPEGLSIHRDQLKRRGQDLDLNVRVRLERAAAMPAADYTATLQERGSCAL